MSTLDRAKRAAAVVLSVAGVILLYAGIYVYMLPYFPGAVLGIPFAVFLHWRNLRTPVDALEAARARSGHDYPHRGFLLNRIPVEGVGGNLYVLTPLIIMAAGAWYAPLAAASFLAAGGVVALALHGRTVPSTTHLGTSFVSFFFVLALVALVGAGSFLWVFVAVGVGGGGLVAMFLLLSRRRPLLGASIRDHQVS